MPSENDNPSNCNDRERRKSGGTHFRAAASASNKALFPISSPVNLPYQSLAQSPHKDYPALPAGIKPKTKKISFNLTGQQELQSIDFYIAASNNYPKITLRKFKRPHSCRSLLYNMKHAKLSIDQLSIDIRSEEQFSRLAEFASMTEAMRHYYFAMRGVDRQVAGQKRSRNMNDLN